MPKYFAHAGGDDLQWFEGEDIKEEYSEYGRKSIALTSPSGGVTHIHWVYGESGVWAVYPTLAAEGTPMVQGATFTTSVSDDEPHSMLLTIECPEPLTVTEIDLPQ